MRETFWIRLFLDHHSSVSVEMVRFAVLSVFLCISAATATIISDCGSVKGTYSKVEVSGCDPDTMRYCPLYRGQNSTLSVTFIPNEEVTSVKAVVHGIIASIPMPFPLPNSNGCYESGLKCPLASASEVTYTTSLPVLTSYPKLTVTVQLELQDQNGIDIVCVNIPSKIKDKNH